MPYWELVTRSFRISWRHKYLWLLALFAGESGGSASFNYPSTPSGTTGRGSLPDVGAINQQASHWLTDNIGLIVGVSVVIVLIAIAFFVLAAVCEGAVVRAAAEHDAERPFGLGWAWRAGTATMGAIIRFRLLLIALALPLLVVFVVLALGFVGAIGGQNGALIVVLVLFGIVFTLAAVPYVILLFFLDRLGTRALVLEQLGAMAALRRGYTLVTKRLGRLLLVGLLSIAVGIAVGICFAIAGLMLIVPAALITVAAYASGSSEWGLVIVLAVLILLPIFLVISAFLEAQGSTYWTLAFRRLEIDRPPAYAYAYAPPQVPQPPPGLPTPF
ncbi:MAG TPA: hypothetical protein VGS16_11770 [Candidatus Dormibacteraeota bacterium]|nr:hypothetical protein [Candidatus Dormibacteraeota bacterium]